MQGPSSVLRFLADREAADLHAPPKENRRHFEDTLVEANSLSAFNLSGVSRFYKESLKKNTSSI